MITTSAYAEGFSFIINNFNSTIPGQVGVKSESAHVLDDA